MATKGSNNASSGELPERTGSTVSSKANLHIQMLERGEDELKRDETCGTKALNLFLCFIALCLLYGFYVFFGWVWLTAMVELGEDLNWAFFGVFVSAFGGMGAGVAYSMKAQRIGWWEPLAPGDARRDRDPRGKCCGFQIY
mmetsp:Transcript_18435/g.29250  ORF Transcript_18435/g.29250 Transcript_18435/m.29250 type:complete len:141 (-) Transcript_18435:637-1059(-)|eukprot:CAMPEP_0197038168 /NCGR_PEP_ID=MMETSP1384-20130603/15157_1 /TAXON_ID=29189 /ORGANISM="Ammonia sp." /LENGTH=140 /DNA_ID=CAMNT_0042468565 /DNA_START=159 /DNA_END=581 /DNA_ORIENTATION=-